MSAGPGRREGGGQGGHVPPEIPMLENSLGVLVNTLLQWLLAYMSSASGGFKTPTIGLCSWTPLGDFCPQSDPRFCPPPKQISGYASGAGYESICSRRLYAVHTADATQLSSCVARRRRRVLKFATSSRRLPTDSVDNLETDQTDSVEV